MFDDTEKKQILLKSYCSKLGFKIVDNELYDGVVLTVADASLKKIDMTPSLAPPHTYKTFFAVILQHYVDTYGSDFQVKLYSGFLDVDDPAVVDKQWHVMTSSNWHSWKIARSNAGAIMI